MTYISNTPEDREAMLEAIGVSSFDDLLAPIPEAIRLSGALKVPPRMDEPALVRHLQELASRNLDLESHLSFLGAGIYDHFRPAIVSALQGRGEFATSYTPYQPEVSQGMLQVIYEYQTHICALTGMDLSNASMYDAATGMAEAALMAVGILERPQVLISRAVHPHYRQVVQTYLDATGYTLVEVTDCDGMTDIDALRTAVSADTACIIVQNPNFFGNLEDLGMATEIAHQAGALSIVSVDPIALGLLKPPAEYGVDIVLGEGQSLGSPMGFGGPLLGFFACKRKFTRHFPGRIVGATVDQQGRRGYTMTLRTREQDIRREKATSNICTNQTLLAVAASIYLSALGANGIRHVADLCLQKAHYCRQQLLQIPGVISPFPTARFFKEFAVNLPADPAEVNRKLRHQRIIGGLPLGDYYPELPNAMLVCVTETRTKDDIDTFVAALAASL